MSDAPQSFANHSRMVPMFHYTASALLAGSLLLSIYQLVRYFSAASVLGLFLTLALAVVYWYSRAFPLTVQDRIIRLEESLRIERLCPDLRGRLGEFTMGQLVSLRFASDEELPALARRVLDEKIVSRSEIKKAIRNWRPDYLRA
ncbi:MAG: DUF6526 family protein [Thermoanaerobaculia bacterium]|jgi:hypothetical protein